RTHFLCSVSIFPTDYHSLSLHVALPIYHEKQYTSNVMLVDSSPHVHRHTNHPLQAGDPLLQNVRGFDGFFLSQGLFLPLIYFPLDRKSTRLNSSHVSISYAVFCLIKELI